MKKITLILLGIFTLVLCSANTIIDTTRSEDKSEDKKVSEKCIYKEVNIKVAGKRAKIIKIKFAEKLEDGRYFFVCDLLDADSTIIAIDRDFYGENAPFEITNPAILDTLTKWHPNYRKK